MLVFRNIHREPTAQAKGSAKIIVSVVATQDIGAGDMLRRLGPETAQDEPRQGNSNNRYTVVGLVAVGVRKLLLQMTFFSTCVLCFSFFLSLVHVCVCVCVCVCLLFSFARVCGDDLYWFSCDVW